MCRCIPSEPGAVTHRTTPRKRQVSSASVHPRLRSRVVFSWHTEPCHVSRRHRHIYGQSRSCDSWVRLEAMSGHAMHLSAVSSCSEGVQRDAHVGRTEIFCNYHFHNTLFTAYSKAIALYAVLVLEGERRWSSTYSLHRHWMGANDQCHTTTAFCPRERIPCTLLRGGLVDSRAGLEAEDGRKTPYPDTEPQTSIP